MLNATDSGRFFSLSKPLPLPEVESSTDAIATTIQLHTLQHMQLFTEWNFHAAEKHPLAMWIFFCVLFVEHHVGEKVFWWSGLAAKSIFLHDNSLDKRVRKNAMKILVACQTFRGEFYEENVTANVPHLQTPFSIFRAGLFAEKARRAMRLTLAIFAINHTDCRKRL